MKPVYILHLFILFFCVNAQENIGSENKLPFHIEFNREDSAGISTINIIAFEKTWEKVSLDIKSIEKLNKKYNQIQKVENEKTREYNFDKHIKIRFKGNQLLEIENDLSLEYDRPFNFFYGYSIDFPESDEYGSVYNPNLLELIGIIFSPYQPLLKENYKLHFDFDQEKTVFTYVFKNNMGNLKSIEVHLSPLIQEDSSNAKELIDVLHYTAKSITYHF